MLPDLSVLWVIALVLLLTAILQQLFFKPLLRVIHAREDAVQSARALAERSAAEARRASEEFDAKTTAARAAFYRELDDMRKTGQDERAAMVADARAQADRELEQARLTLAADTAQARGQLEQDAQHLGHQLADRLAGRTR
ncbi:ATP synthase F0 subunit B [Luteitalea sp.]|uniref:ATP synthase F0 subunit B n=1 Tax=Luteitalea sp. TaxID=2004800 RepID=UPI0025BFE14A|nr:ATP synthase F0 subunit B [Luteitalea sp.]